MRRVVGHPNFKMIERPVWSTWAEFKRDVNDSVVRKFAQEIVDNGYKDGQFELDDDWEVTLNSQDKLRLEILVCRFAMEP